MATFGEHIPKPCNPKTCGTTSWLIQVATHSVLQTGLLKQTDTHITLVTQSSETPWVHHQFHWLNVCVRRPSNWTLTSSYSHPHIGSSGPRTPYLISSSPLCSSPQPIICLHLSLSSASASITLPNFMYSSSINLLFALPRGLLSANSNLSTLLHLYSLSPLWSGRVWPLCLHSWQNWSELFSLWGAEHHCRRPLEFPDPTLKSTSNSIMLVSGG